jgi:hypothetical protein
MKGYVMVNYKQYSVLMRQLKLLFCFSLFIFHFSFSYGQNWLWGEKNSDNGALLHASPVATDKNGNAYITGSNENTTVFGNDTLTNTKYSSYLVKYNSLGTVIWANHIIDSTGGKSYGNAVATDKAGSIYINGNFWGNAQAGTFSLYGNNNITDNYLVKYNANGVVLWAKQSISSPTNNYSNSSSVATDKDGDVYICGSFSSTITFGSFTLNNGGIFLVKYDSNGNALWAKQGEPNSELSGGEGNTVTTDKNDNVYITGCFFDTLSFGSTTLIDAYGGYQYSCFIAKYSSSGNVIWAKQTANTTINGDCTANAIVTDKENSIYITGSFGDSVEFGSTILYNTQYPFSAFLAKYDSNGNAIWAYQSSPLWSGTGLASDAHNHIYMVGQDYWNWTIYDTLLFDGSTFYVNPSAISASFIMELNTSGQLLCGSLINNVGQGADSGTGVASDSTGTYVYVASALNDSVFCGPDTLVSTGMFQNSFLGRWQNCGVTAGVNQITPQNSSVILYPNPNNGYFTLSLSNVNAACNVEIYNILGEKVFSEILQQNQSNSAINITGQPSGVYLYRVLSVDDNLLGEGKVVVLH